MNKHDFDQLQITWKNFGNSEPFWSVLTHEQYKFHNINDSNTKEFYETGKGTIEFFENILQKHNSTFKDKIVLDFGCGVGRLTKPLSHCASQVYGLDISEAHLKIAKEHDTKTQFFLVDDLQKLPELPNKPNIILSIIVLQHARPSVIKHQVGLLLEVLEMGGIALLHIPYDILNYQEIVNQINVMEMHFVSQFEIFNIVELHNCEVLEIVNQDFCGSELIKNCIYVIKKL